MLLFIRWLPAILWMLIIYIFSASSNPFQVVPQSITVPDETIGRVAHVIEYAILAMLIGRASIEPKIINLNDAIRVFIISISYGLFDELHQTLIPRRAFEVLDLGLDSLGIMIGLGLLVSLGNRKRISE